MAPKKQRRRDDGASGSGAGAGAQQSTPATDGVDEERTKLDEEQGARLLPEAREAAAKIVEDAKAAGKAAGEAAGKAATKQEWHKVKKVKEETQRERAALEAEKAAMDNAHAFQNNTILLDVGGHKFTASRQTLTSVPNTYLESMFSGRYELTPKADGSYFIDRDGRYFIYILRDCGSFTLIPGLLREAQREELKVELEFYGLLDRMMPYYVQERIAKSLLKRACLTGTKLALQTAVAQSGALVFEVGSTSPFLNEKYQDLRFVITDRVVNGSPVWAAGGKRFMYRNANNMMMICVGESHCADGSKTGIMCNTEATTRVVAPTECPSDKWESGSRATLESQIAAAERRIPESLWARVPEMRITAVHGLDDDDPKMAAALRQLAALA